MQTWTPLGHEPGVVLEELTRLYWCGVERDLLCIMVSLHIWSHDRYASIVRSALSPQHEAEARWSGFEAFVARATGAEGEEL